ncbi:MAG TPA: DsbE family thiol:disulfide interchange protein [Rubrivivax sp.]|nr:DsbE family thiol:disulfide interchange protein [Rubrivivax sp.]
MKRYLIPLALFVVLAGFLAVGLQRDPRKVPSPLIDKPAPAFSAPRLDEPAQQVALDDMLGQVWVLNVWASWCVPCRIEHPLWVEWAKTQQVPLVGLNYKDKRDDALAWLARYGDPYKLSLADIQGLVAIDYGVYGVPETFVIDKAGIIRHKHIGPISADDLRDTILPLVRKLGA